MKSLKQLTFMFCLALALAPVWLRAQVPQLISYQGRVTAGGTNFNGSGQFKFALIRGGVAPSLWSNDGTSVNGSEPTAAVSITVANGVFTVLLGDATLPNMTVIPATVFASTTDIRLRVWFNDGVSGFQQLSPDQRIAAVGYAMMSADIADGAITASKLADGAVTQTKLANGAVTSGKIANDAIGAIQIAPGAVNSSDIADGSILGVDIANGTLTGLQLADALELGSTSTVGQLDIYRTPVNTPAISLLGATSQISVYGTNGAEKVRLFSQGASYGELWLNDRVNENRSVLLTAGNETGGSLSLRDSNGLNRVFLSGANNGGNLTLYQADSGIGVFIDGDASGAGLMDVRNTNGSTLLRLAADQGGRIESAGTVSVMSGVGGDVYSSLGKNGSGGGVVRTYDELGNQTMIAGSIATGGGGFINVHRNASIWPGVTIDGDDGDSGRIDINAQTISTRIRLDADNGLTSEISLFHTNNVETIEIIASEGGTTGGQILMRNAAGVNTIQLDSDASGVACGYLALSRSNGAVNIILNSQDGTVQGQVVEITGGSDFSEKFDIRGEALEPGMIVSIDPSNPGQLTLSSSAHDKKVAGIISGAGGVKPGMLMGQRGSVADGQHPVALTGRVYCWVDADANGAIEPGDMLTTSSTPGHGMKVTDQLRATGAIIGKAMTALDRGKGLVLVLVNLQ